MAVAAGSALRSVAMKMRGVTVSPGASPVHRAHLLDSRRPGPTSSQQPFSSSSSVPSGSTPPPINDKNLRQKIAAKMPYFVIMGCAAFIYFWIDPRMEAMAKELNALRRERSILIKAVEDCERTHIEAKGHGKESDGQKTS